MTAIFTSIKAAVEKLESILDSESAPTAVVLGSGMASVVNSFEKLAGLDFEDIPGFSKSTVQGHAGKLLFCNSDSHSFLIQQGRFHAYEGYNWEQLTFPVRVMAAAGVRNFILFNAAGSVNPGYSPGDLVLIADHINFSFLHSSGPIPVINNKGIWNAGLKSLAKKAAEKSRVNLKEGIYQYMTGPSYETPAEVKMASKLGADLLGMSTVPEALVAADLGARVIGISVVSNPGAGLFSQAVDHSKVTEVVDASSGKISEFIRHLISLIHNSH